MDANQIIFYFLSGFVISSALLILVSKNIVRSVFLLMVVFIGVAIIYFISGAEFVGVTQIMIYVGGILILMMFGVMLTSRVDGNLLVTEHTRLLSGVLIGAGIFAVVAYAVLTNDNTFMVNDKTLPTSTKDIGISLMTHHILALEIVAILLLVALIGASFIAGNENRERL